jgi:hypothetical protein
MGSLNISICVLNIIDRKVQRVKVNNSFNINKLNDYQGWILTFEPTCPIGQVTVKFYFSEVLLTSKMHDQFQG